MVYLQLWKMVTVPVQITPVFSSTCGGRFISLNSHRESKKARRRRLGSAGSGDGGSLSFPSWPLPLSPLPATLSPLSLGLVGGAAGAGRGLRWRGRPYGFWFLGSRVWVRVLWCWGSIGHRKVGGAGGAAGGWRVAVEEEASGFRKMKETAGSTLAKLQPAVI
jgi:hypothetical protein